MQRERMTRGAHAAAPYRKKRKKRHSPGQNSEAFANVRGEEERETDALESSHPSKLTSDPMPRRRLENCRWSSTCRASAIFAQKQGAPPRVVSRCAATSGGQVYVHLLRKVSSKYFTSESSSCRKTNQSSRRFGKKRQKRPSTSG